MFKIKRFLMFNCFSKVNWSVNWVDYNPRDYTASKLIKEKPVWADIVNSRDISFWNELDPNTKVDRRSHMGNYKVIDGLPQNPVNILIERERKRVKKRNILVYFKFSTQVGRTGIKGRGLLGRWGVNHAADPIVTR